MSDLISRSEVTESIKRQYCTGCDNYNGSRCRACHADDMLSLVDDAADAGPRWISVEERLPDIDAEVLIYTNEGLYNVAQYSGGERFWTLERNPDCWVTALGVTHWMPLPSAEGIK